MFSEGAVPILSMTVYPMDLGPAGTPRLPSQSTLLSVLCCVFEMGSQAGVVVHTFSPSTQKPKQVDLHEFEASLIYKVNSRTSRTL